jgi:hypothetical protein
VRYEFTDVSAERTASVFRVEKQLSKKQVLLFCMSNAGWVSYNSALKTEAVNFFETFMTFYRVTRGHTPVLSSSETSIVK